MQMIFEANNTNDLVAQIKQFLVVTGNGGVIPPVAHHWVRSAVQSGMVCHECKISISTAEASGVINECDGAPLPPKESAMTRPR